MNRPRLPRLEGRLLVLVFALVSVSCGDLLGPDPLDPTDPANLLSPIGRSSLEVTPAGPLLLMVGDTVTLRALRAGAFELVFTSSDSTIATVTAQGFVTARLPGEARVSVSMRSDPRARATVVARIDSRGPAAIDLDSLGSIDDLPVLADSVAGVFHPRFALQRGDATRLEVRLDTTLACAMDLPRTVAAGTRNALEHLHCRVDTAAFDSVSGAPRFGNGAVTMSARLVRSDGRELAVTSGTPIRLRNRNALVGILDATRTAVDGTGRRWHTGDLTMRALPVLYDAGAEVGSVRFEYRSGSGQTLEVNDATAPFAATFTAAQIGARVDEGIQFSLSSTGSNGEPGPALVSGPIRYDAIAPGVGILRRQPWIGATLPFASLYEPAPHGDAGVGGVKLRFVAGERNLGTDELLERGLRVERGGELAESLPETYRIVYFICDALDNCTRQEGFDFGVDVRPPVISHINLADRTINPGSDLSFSVVDDLSGIAGAGLRASTLALVAGSSQAVCGPVVDGLDLPGVEDSFTCAPTSVTTDLRIPRSTPGYYFYRVEAVDQAGNHSETFERAFLVDNSAPTIGSFTVPGDFVAGKEATLAASVADALDLAEVSFQLGFPLIGGERITLPFAPAIVVGTPFGGRPTRTASVSARMPFVRSLTYSAPGSGGRSTVVVDSLHAVVVDAAGLQARSNQALSPASFGGNVSTTDPFGAVASITAALNTQRVCTAGCLASEATGLAATVRVVGQPGMSALARMYLFASTPTGVRMLGSTSSFAVSETGTQRTFTYTFTYSPPPGLTGRHSIFAVALSAAGNGLKSADTPVDFVAR